MSFWDFNGLLNAKFGEKGGENSLLFTYEQLVLLRLAKLSDDDLVDHLNDILGLCEFKPGLFYQHPSNYDYCSHDQMTAICCYSSFYGKDYHKRLWTILKKQLFRYDTKDIDNPSWDRIQHPRDIIFLGYLANNPICYILLPILLIMMLLSFNKPLESTSGKILWFVRSYSMKGIYGWIFRKICGILIKRSYGKNGLGKLFSIYFKQESNPNNLISRNIDEF